MGKSTVLTKLSKEIKSQNESAWVIKIDLNICSQQFKSFNFADINNEDKLIDFISISLLNHQDSLEQALFKYFIHCKNRLIVLLDGFDEISPDYDSIVIHLVEFLSETVKQLWVTTRPTSKHCLQDALETLSFTLKPFTNEDQVLFLTKYWSKYLEISVLLDNTKIELFAKELLRQMSVSIQSKTFTDNPLQTRMLAEVFETELEQFYYSDLTRPILSDKLNLHQLYESFVEKKFSIYFDDKNQTDTSKTSAKLDQSILKAHYLIMHQHYALLSLISKKDLEKLLSKDYIKDVQIQKNQVKV